MSAPLAQAAAAIRAVCGAEDPELAMRLALEALDRDLGLKHTMILLLDEGRATLYAVHGHGYPDGVAGAEVRVGEGYLGTVARTGRSIRVGAIRTLMNYTRTQRLEAAMAGHAVGRQIPLPGLPQLESAMVVPLRARGEVIGVLGAESDRPMAFSAEQEHAAEIVATALAQHLALLETDSESSAGEPAVPRPDAAGPIRQVELYLADDSVFVDHEYVIKGVAGRILVKLLREHAAGRREFTNKELRLDRWLQLPALNANLENRLLLLRQRLHDGGFGIRIERTGRGRFAVRVDGSVAVVERP